MKAGTDKLLKRARSAVEAGAASLARGREAQAAQRAYYGMLYAAKALLNERGLRYSSHARIVEALQRDLRGRDDSAGEPLQWLAEAVQRREEMACDDLAPSAEEVDALLARAREFVRVAEVCAGG